MKPKVLVITPVKHINGVREVLESFAEVTYLEDPSLQEVIEIIEPYDSIFTNPNKSKVFIGSELINAAKNGKEVVVQIELQARFDETNNIDYAKLMQDQGVKLIFGIPTLKVHAKVCVVEKLINSGLIPN